MATFATSQAWLQQCSLLLEAQPLTTKITSRYSVRPKPARRVKKTAGEANAPTASSTTTTTKTTTTAKPTSTHATQNPRAKLVLKAVDPASGVCLRYETTKAAEVTRLVQMLGQLSRRQAGLVAAATPTDAQEPTDDVVMTEAPAAAPTAAAQAQAATAPAPAAAPPPQAGGGKGKKKKGKR